MADELDVAALAAEPASTSGDQGSASNRPIPEVIQADQYATAKTALSGTNRRGGRRCGWAGLVRRGKFVPADNC